MKKIFYVLLLVVFLTSCGIGISNDKVNLDAGDAKMKITDDEVKIGLGDESIEITDDKVKIGSFLEISDDEGNSDNKESASNIGEEASSCEQNYADLLEKYSKNYSDCYFKKPDIASCESGDIEKGNLNLLVIFDASGSMGASIGGETMMDLAKEKVSDYISDLDEDTNLSFILYGHKGAGTQALKNESCEGVETIYDFSDKNIESLKSQISGFKANGWTSITKSLKQAKELIKNQAGENDKNIILLVSDGKETCGGSPVVEALNVSKIKNTYIDVIGFNVKGDTQKQLMEIAKNGNGNYYDVKSRLDFEDTFNKTKNFLDTMSCGASKAAIQLSYGVEAINKYYTCLYNLREEQIFMMVDAQDSCKDYFQDKLDSRYLEHEEKFENILEQGQEILDDFGTIIEEVEEQFED